MFTLLPWTETITEQTNSALSRLITQWLKASAGVSKDDTNTIHMLIILYKKMSYLKSVQETKTMLKHKWQNSKVLTSSQNACCFERQSSSSSLQFLQLKHTLRKLNHIHKATAYSHQKHFIFPFHFKFHTKWDLFACGVVSAVCKLTINAFPPWQVLSFAKRKQWTVLSFWSDELHSSWSETIRRWPLQVLTDLVYST